MNNKGNVTIFVFLMIGVVVFFLALNLAYPMKQVASNAMAESNYTNHTVGLNCSTVTAYQDRANCTMVDLMTPTLVLTLLGLGGYLLAKTFI